MSLYALTQKFVRLGFKLFFRKVHVLHLNRVPVKDPVLLVANHPNSFMDALLIGAYLPRSTNFLARGDAFNNPILAKVFKAYNMLPVYRASEGKENIAKNFETFDASFEAMKREECLLIFGEGLSINNWQLRPLKKGPARIAQRAWLSNTAVHDLIIIPVGLTYSHYNGAGKSAIVNYGKPITRQDLNQEINSPGFTLNLNEKIAAELQKLAYFNKELRDNSLAHQQFISVWHNAEHQKQDVLTALHTYTFSKNNTLKNCSSLNKINSTVISSPHYLLSKFITHKLTKGTVFYDSVLFILYWFLLPVYLVVLAAIISYLI